MAPLTEQLEPPPVETYADQLEKVRQASDQLSWVQVLGKYCSMLFSSVNNNAMTLKPICKSPKVIHFAKTF